MHVGIRYAFGSCIRSRAGYATAIEAGEGGKARSTMKNPFPYPMHDNPTPQQIFHLPASATKAQIKSRYYELVRAHHPDSAHVVNLEPTVAHARFHNIKASYDFLCGRTLSPHLNARPAPSPQHFDPYMHELARRRRAYYASQGRQSTDSHDSDARNWTKGGWEGFGAPTRERSDWNEDGWRERTILAFGVVALIAGLFPSLPSNIAQAFLPTSFFDYGSPPSDSKPQSKQNTEPPATAQSFSIPFIDLDRGHRAAVSALVQARTEREETALERREEMKKRVREMGEINGGANGGASDGPTTTSGGDARTVDPMSHGELETARGPNPSVPAPSVLILDNPVDVTQSAASLSPSPLHSDDPRVKETEDSMSTAPLPPAHSDAASRSEEVSSPATPPTP